MHKKVLRLRRHFLPKLLGFIICTSIAYTAMGQIGVTKPKFKDDGSKLIIEYQINNSKPSDRFLIEVLVTDDDGNIVEASTLSGDVGEDVSGGRKRIIWEYSKDDVLYETTVTIKIRYDKLEEEPEVQPSVIVPASTKSYSRSGLILQSIALPGLGLSRYTGKPHWLRGVAGYGCIAGSVVFNRLAQDTFDSIEDLTDYDEINDAYDKSVTQDNTSEILAYSAIAIWVVDFIWTFVGTSDLGKGGLSSESKGFSVVSKIDPLSYAPTIGVRYRF